MQILYAHRTIHNINMDKKNSYDKMQRSISLQNSEVKITVWDTVSDRTKNGFVREIYRNNTV